MEFRQKISVFQIVSYQLNYVSKDLQFQLQAILNHMEQFETILKVFK